MKILYVTTVGLTMGFFKNIVRTLIDHGNSVDIATNEKDYKVDNVYREMGCNIYQIDFSRSPINHCNVKAYKQFKKLVSDNHYDIVHCHTPAASVITRLACRRIRKDRLKVFYTAHGFHFYRGAPLKNWMFFYPVEKFCSHFTDVLITINHEDYEFAQKKMKAKRIEYVPGVGIDVDRFANTTVDRAAKRKELGIPEDAFLLLSVGELNKNKNHQVVIKALSKLNDQNIHYMIAGEGYLHEKLTDLAQKLNISDRIHILGYRNDVAKLYKTADVFVLPSLREGLNVSLIEAEASGSAIICGKIRGNTDCASDDERYRLVSPLKIDDYVCAISEMMNTDPLSVGSNDRISFVKCFSEKVVIEKMARLYE